MNSAAANLDSFYAYKDTFDQDSVWLEIPKTVTFINVTDPYATSPSPQLDGTATEPTCQVYEQEEGVVGASDRQYTDYGEAHNLGLEALSAAALGDATLHQAADTEDTDMAPMGNDSFTPSGLEPLTQTPSSNNLHLVLNPASTLLTETDPSLLRYESSQGSPGPWLGYRAAGGSHLKASTETNHQTAFLLRHFSEVTGRWMDLFDQTTFFSSHIPVKSISSPLLKHAACAYAAKQLGRVGGMKARVGGICSHQATMEVWQGGNEENWGLLAAEHYDQAIPLLKESLQWGSPGNNSSKEIDKRHYATRTIDGMVEERKLRRRQFGSAQSTAWSDGLLAATAILCEFESLDASNAAWAHHLSGTKSLLDVVEVGMMPLDSQTIPLPAKKPSQARKAIFWNFARQDMFAALRNECRTRLDTEDIPLWRDAGLLLDEDNLVIPGNLPESRLPEGYREDMMGNALIWLVSKLMNLICAAPDDDSASLSARWVALDREMEVWFNGIPETFMPSAIIPVNPYGASLTEVWSSIPVTQATVMTWHMAQVLMHVHKPPEPLLRRPTVAERVKSYRNIDQEIAFHSRQILGMCLSRPDASVRIHALHPLFVAGQCLTETAERRVVVDLLRGVEQDLGWATEYRVQQLLQEWEWENGEELGQG